MAEYIEREDAIAIIEEKQKELCPVGRYGRGYVYGSDREKYDAWDEIIDALENIPSADIAPVVRCKDCKHLWVWNRKDIYAFCPKTSIVFLPFDKDTRTFFCNYGERKDEANES